MKGSVKRQNNFELLRIISMLLIVSFHCVYYGGFAYSGTFNVTKWMLKEFWLFGQLGVNLFMLISGYFLVGSGYRSEKMMILVMQVYFYHILSCVVAWELGVFDGSTLMVLLTEMLLPITRRTYWYISAYLMIYIFSPFINRMIHALSQREFAKLLLVCFVLWSVLPTISGWAIGVENDLYYYNRFIWCGFIYLLGAYIRLYSLPIIDSKRGAAWLAGVSFLMASFAIPIIAFCCPRLGLSVEPAYFWHPNTVLMLFMSIGVFGIVKNIEIPNCKWIPVVGSTTLGIYLFHDGKLRPLLWSRIFNGAAYQDSPWLICYILISILVVFLSGFVVEWLRQRIVKLMRKSRKLQAIDMWIMQKCQGMMLRLYRIFGI